MSRRVLVIGGSDQGRQAIDVLEAGGHHEVVGVLDDNVAVGTDVGGARVLGGSDDLPTCARATGAQCFLVAIGDNATRGSLFEAAHAACPDLEPASAIHPSAVLARDAVVGGGAIVIAGAVVSNGCRIGVGALLGTNSSLEHDGEVGDFVSLGPGAKTGGRVTIGAYTAIGLGANVIHSVTIGSHSVVGAASLVLDDLPDLVVAHGAPARVTRARVAGDRYL